MDLVTASKSETKDHVIRLPFIWIIMAGLAMIILGFIGSLLAMQIFKPATIPLQKETEHLVSTVQQVTISPNNNAAAIIDKNDRSILLLASTEANQINWLGTGFVITNDGLIVTSATIPATNISAYDNTGRIMKLDWVGRDEVFGLTYLQAAQNVLVPLDLAQNDAAIGTQGLLLGRSNTTFQPRVSAYLTSEYILPPSDAAPGIQKMIRGSSLNDQLFKGSPVLNDDGKITSIILDPSQGTSLPVSHLSASLSRLTNKQLPSNLFTTYGLNVNYIFASSQPDKPVQFVAKISNILPKTPAERAGLQRDDIITAINNQTLDWNQPIAVQLAEKLPLSINFIRNGVGKTTTLDNVPISPEAKKP